MICERSGFRLVERGCKDTLLAIPGWATDSRIFARLDLKFNYLLPVDLDPLKFCDRLSRVLEERSINKISILGWSMGSFLASEYAKRYPHKVRGLFLVAARRKYEKDDIKKIRTYLDRNKKAYLYKFYEALFSPEEKNEASWFRKNLLNDYLNEMPDLSLQKGLDLLENAELDMTGLEKANPIFIHGTADSISPFDELNSIKNFPGGARLIRIENGGHALFLRSDFKAIFDRVARYE